MKRLFLVALILIFVVGCAGKQGVFPKPEKPTGGVGQQKYVDEFTIYDTGVLPMGWKRLWGYNADLAFFNEVHRTTIVVNSTCGINKQMPLAALRNHLLFDITDRIVVTEEELVLDLRTALHTVVQGRLDGALIKIGIYVFQVDTCIYDLVYIAGLEQYEICQMDFENFVKGFHVKRRG